MWQHVYSSLWKSGEEIFQNVRENIWLRQILRCRVLSVLLSDLFRKSLENVKQVDQTGDVSDRLTNFFPQCI